MQSYLNHIQINIDFENIQFYKDLLEFLGWKVLFEDKEIVGFNSTKTGTIWFLPKTNNTQNNYDAPGMNHVGIGVDTIEWVDEITDFLRKMGIEPLFDTPKYRPEFSGGDNIYYQVMFETPDKVLFEVVCSGPKPK
jgi:catechol 2,3-dioxygenase-like lactoylglutathione lyase family enzyme